MPRSRKTIRKQQSLRSETLESRQMMSATPGEHGVTPNVTQQTSALVASPAVESSQPSVAPAQFNRFIPELAATLLPGSLASLMAATPKVGLDNSLSDDGIVHYPDIRDVNSAEDLVVQPDGRIVAVVGTWIWRFNVDGNLDTTFGGGRVRLSIPSTGSLSGAA